MVVGKAILWIILPMLSLALHIANILLIICYTLVRLVGHWIAIKGI